jgi:CheY-like chemotaxis protein
MMTKINAGRLPGMSGLKLQEQLSAERNETAIVFITAYDNTRSQEQAHAMGCAIDENPSQGRSVKVFEHNASVEHEPISPQHSRIALYEPLPTHWSR